MSLSKYAYVSARIGGMRSYLLDSGEIRALMEATGLEDAISLLKNTYGKDLGKIEGSSLREVEKILTADLLGDFEKMVRSTKKAERTFFEQYAKFFEIGALKILLTMKLAKPVPRIDLHWVFSRSLPEATINKLLKMETLDELFEMLRYTEYYPLLKTLAERHRGTSDPLPFLAALDKYVYGKLWGTIKGLTGRDRRFAERFIGVEIDKRNLIAVLRLRGEEESVVWDNLIPVRYKLLDEDFSLILSLRRLSELPAEARKPTRAHKFPYQEIIFPGLKEYEETRSTQTIENGFRKMFLEQSVEIFRGYRFHLGLPLAYLYLKENEIRNVIAILKGKEAGLPTSTIEKLVALV